MKTTLQKAIASRVSGANRTSPPNRTSRAQVASPGKPNVAPSLAAYATYGEKHRATEILTQIVASTSSDAAAFAALDEAFDLVERIRGRVGR
jgi:hypothetical protein